MPNGYQEHRDRVWGKSRFWGVVWSVGDTSYYLGLLGSVLGPPAVVGLRVLRFVSWHDLLRGVGLAVVLFLVCFPAGVLVCAVFKGTAEQATGTDSGALKPPHP